MSIDSPIQLNDQISEEAAQWLLELRTGDIDAAGLRDFDGWLRASPEHIRAFIDMAAIWHEGGAIDSRRRLDVEAIIARARSEENIVALAAGQELPPATRTASVSPIETASETARESVGSRRARAARRAVAASLLVAVIATALILGSGLLSRSTTYVSGLRTRRSIVLPDGSTALLDSRSRLRVSYTAAARAVELLQGQALFRVVKDIERPFLVQAGHTVVRDVGTVFDVNRREDGTIVTVVEGRVAVANPSETARPQPAYPSAPAYVSAGQQLEVQGGRFPLRPSDIDVSSQIAWTHGQVVLESATLAEVAQVFTRYSTRRLVAQDLGKKPLRLSGVFSTNPGFVIAYLRGRPDIVVTETGSEIDIVRSPGGYRP
jgi:transmembrane sensor